MDILNTVGTIISGGAAGGFTLGMIKETSYNVRLPGAQVVNVGFLGDMLIGGVAALSVFAIAGPILNIDISALDNVGEFVKVLAVAVVSGFGGISLLQRVSDNLALKVNEVEGEIEQIKKYEKAELFVVQGKHLLGNRQYEEANVYFEHALTIDPKNLSALINRCLCARRSGNLERAYSYCDIAIARHPEDQTSYYNRACYGVLLEKPLDVVFQDLRKSISIFPVYKNFALADPDFKNVLGNTEFIEITANT